jgi:hypothetical protein
MPYSFLLAEFFLCAHPIPVSWISRPHDTSHYNLYIFQDTVYLKLLISEPVYTDSKIVQITAALRSLICALSCLLKQPYPVLNTVCCCAVCLSCYINHQLYTFVIFYTIRHIRYQSTLIRSININEARNVQRHTCTAVYSLLI